MQLPAHETELFRLLIVFASAATLASVLFFIVLERALSRRTRIYDVPLREGQLAREISGNLLFLAIFAAGMTLVFARDRVDVAPFSLAGAALTFFGALISFDLYYYALHALMHTRVGAPFHRWHHASRVNTPWTALSLSPLESAAWVLGLAAWPLLAAGTLPFVLEGYVAWLAFFFFSNTMGHVNVEFVPAFVSATPVGRIATHGVIYHAMHHARYQKHLCFFMNGLDTAFGQVWEDYPELHQRVLAGHPLERLGERAVVTGTDPEESSD